MAVKNCQICPETAGALANKALWRHCLFFFFLIAQCGNFNFKLRDHFILACDIIYSKQLYNGTFSAQSGAPGVELERMPTDQETSC